VATSAYSPTIETLLNCKLLPLVDHHYVHTYTILNQRLWHTSTFAEEFRAARWHLGVSGTGTNADTPANFHIRAVGVDSGIVGVELLESKADVSRIVEESEADFTC
jgi:hypothetical protein